MLQTHDLGRCLRSSSSSSSSSSSTQPESLLEGYRQPRQKNMNLMLQSHNLGCCLHSSSSSRQQAAANTLGVFWTKHNSGKQVAFHTASSWPGFMYVPVAASPACCSSWNTCCWISGWEACTQQHIAEGIWVFDSYT
jgi:hypothetical protein